MERVLAQLETRFQLPDTILMASTARAGMGIAADRSDRGREDKSGAEYNPSPSAKNKQQSGLSAARLVSCPWTGLAR